MTRSITHMTLEGGVLFFEDGTEVSGVSVEMLAAVPDMLEALELLMSFNGSEPRLHGNPHVDWELRQQKAREAIAKATRHSGRRRIAGFGDFPEEEE